MANGKKILKESAPKKSRSREGKNRGSYDSYIRRVLLRVHPSGGISKRALGVMNSCMEGLEHRLAAQAGVLVKNSNAQTLRGKDIQSALCLIFPSELCRHAVAEGAKAVRRSKEETVTI
jgi:histone H3/H4